MDQMVQPLGLDESAPLPPLPPPADEAPPLPPAPPGVAADAEHIRMLRALADRVTALEATVGSLRAEIQQLQLERRSTNSLNDSSEQLSGTDSGPGSFQDVSAAQLSQETSSVT